MFYALLTAGAAQTKQYHNVLMNESKKADVQRQRYAMNKRSDAAVKHAVFRNVRRFLDIPQSTMKDQRGQGLCVTEIH